MAFDRRGFLKSVLAASALAAADALPHGKIG
jgi:hypothetical protein